MYLVFYDNKWLRVTNELHAQLLVDFERLIMFEVIDDHINSLLE